MLFRGTRPKKINIDKLPLVIYELYLIYNLLTQYYLNIIGGIYCILILFCYYI